MTKPKKNLKKVVEEKKQEKPKQEKSVPVLKALRDGFGEGIVLAAQENPNIVALSADLTESNRLMDFKKMFPDRFVCVGVAEQNLVGLAAGMAHAGKVPFAASFAVFSPGRSWDQLRVSVCYSNNNVKIYGGHAGVTTGEDGATHQALEDIAITRVLPRMTVIVPADATEMKKATLAAAKMQGPVYLRGGREKLPQVTNEETPFEIGVATMLRTGKDITLIACGNLVYEAMVAAEQLKAKKIDAAVMNLHTIKPLDIDAIIDAAHETGAIVTCEEHQITGGMGSAVCEVVCDNYPVPVECIAIKDTFTESGTGAALMDKYGLRAKDIVIAAQRALERKKYGGKKELLTITKKEVKELKKLKINKRLNR